MQGSSFDISQWYEGQELLVSYESLRQADWLPGLKPSERTRRSINKGVHGRLHVTVEKVKLTGLEVDWMCYTLGDKDTAPAQRPPATLEGDDVLKAVHRLDWFEYQTAQVLLQPRPSPPIPSSSSP